jgi:poly(A) polymerase
VLPEARRLDRLRRMLTIEPEPDPLRRLAALIEADAGGAAALAERLRFPNAWRDRLWNLAAPWPLDPDTDAAAQRRALYSLGDARYRDLALLEAADGRMNDKRLAELIALAGAWTSPQFPLTGYDVTALGIPPGPRVGALLDAVERWWEAGDFVASRDQCLICLREMTKRIPA